MNKKRKKPMPLPNERIAFLLEAYTSQKATAQEEQELLEWMQEAQEDSALKTYIQRLWDQHQTATDFSHVNWNGMFDQVINGGKVVSMTPAPKQKRLRWLRITAAAAVLLLIASGAYFWLNPKNTDQRDAGVVQQLASHDVPAPTGNKAIISLSDGKQVSLDSLQAGLLAQQGDIQLVKLADGQIAYQSAGGETVKEVQYNTLYNPKGSKVINMALADGSQVWLNAGSSVTFPVAFVSNERKVSITGEAYFEVAHDAKKPFKVVKDKMEVTVLGTHFNVSAYDDEPAIAITLLEGSVNVRHGLAKEQLKPGQQAVVKNNISVKNDVDMELVMAWKNGLFAFKGTSLDEVMRQIARWYNVEVKYEGGIPNRQFGGKIHRDANISQVLKILEESNVHYKISNREILILK
jgi:transmembrane sensor